MKIYSTYNDSGILWIPKKPENWAVCRSKALFQSQKETNLNNKETNVLSLTLKGVIRNNKDKPIGLSPSDYSTYQIFEKGDLVFKLIDLNNIATSRVGLVPERGIMSSAYIRLIPRSADLRTRYFYMQYYSLWLRNIFNNLGAGVRQTINANELLNMKIVVPSPSEQDQIVRFLDWKVSSINKLIKTKKWQINSYKELAKAKIESQLNNYPIEKNVLLKNLGMFFKGGGFSRKDLIEDNKYPAILYGDIYTQYEYKTSTINHFIDSDTYTASRKIINGDIVMAGTGETKEEIGKPILYTGNQMVAVGGDIIVFRPYKMGNAEYLLYQLYSQAALKHRYINGKGDIIVHIYPTTLGNTPISLPSDSDQMKAVEKINKIISQTNKTTALLIEEITTLKEFKTRLISDVVTGQIDVRNIEIPEYEYVDEELESDSDDVDGDFDSEDISEEA